jgi:hypothetical protein
MAFTSFRCGVVAGLAAPVTAAAGLLLGGMKDPLMTDEMGDRMGRARQIRA